MKVAVWDTYVKKDDGSLMHFDILVPALSVKAEKVYDYGVEYLNGKGQKVKHISTNECQFCHVEEATIEMLNAIQTKGYYIIEMQGCN